MAAEKTSQNREKIETKKGSEKLEISEETIVARTNVLKSALKKAAEVAEKRYGLPKKVFSSLVRVGTIGENPNWSNANSVEQGYTYENGKPFNKQEPTLIRTPSNRGGRTPGYIVTEMLNSIVAKEVEASFKVPVRR